MHILPMYYFKAVVKYKSINKAAHELHITQQTLSAHMNSIERELGCILFNRSPNFQLTYEGEKFYRYVKTIINTYESMQKEFSLLAQNESGAIRIGIAHTRSQALIPRAAARFIPQYPYVRIDLKELSNDKLISELREGKLDIAIGDIPLDSTEYATEILHKEEILLVVPTTYMRNNASYTEILSEVPLLVSHSEDITGRMARAIVKENHIVPNIAVSSDNIETLLDMCSLGLGACFCSDKLLTFHVSTNDSFNKNLKIYHTNIIYPIIAAYPKDDVMEKIIKTFIEGIKE
ncbi:LysR family transcriptional regulator [Dialister pneumosintes]|jgi:Transcriptional regulator|uniref:LysR family transcriptional regulator n=1 Tax=Dialister pneumosintes TaxID=39950 RepID=A0ABX9M9Q5_9FIRM|nr:LysR family transcriptional regulator [Dialister pneumosintes]MBS6480066.1 LysR family transcriptional regulator [Dialister sp.]RID94239.1 LysR family transcriptional regulator [Dialister pneumosintes]CDF27314.1 lysR substrate-binding domain protein [Dialister sp. CAG:588]